MYVILPVRVHRDFLFPSFPLIQKEHLSARLNHWIVIGFNGVPLR